MRKKRKKSRKRLILRDFNSRHLFSYLTVEVIDIKRFQHPTLKNGSVVETMIFQELNNDQRREAINSRQRFEASRKATTDVSRFKGSMVWARAGATEYLVRSAYDPKTGLRRQKSLGPRSPQLEQIKIEFERGRKEAKGRVEQLEETLDRQASINRAVGIARMPLTGAKIVRALDAAGLLGKAIRIVGTNAIYAYEAAAGVFVEPGLTTTEDIDLLFDARQKIRLTSPETVSEHTLIAVLRRVDRSFERDDQTFRAVNRDGYLVDFIKPIPNPPWTTEREQLIEHEADLVAVGIDGLGWLQSSPAFESVVIDERGMPLRMVTADPRVYSIHKLWLSTKVDRNALKRNRDGAQAKVVAQLAARYLTHLRYSREELEMVPMDLFARASPLFQVAATT
jgi:hypothetical protein